MAIVIGIIALLIAAFVIYEKQRSSNLGKIANRLGLSLHQGRSPLPEQLANNYYLTSAYGGEARNIMQGNIDGLQHVYFEYIYDAAFGDEADQFLPNSDDDGTQEQHRLLVAWLPKTNLSGFDLSPNDQSIRTVSRVTKLAPMTINSSETFNQQYRLLGNRREAIEQLFDDAIVGELLKYNDLAIESRDDGLLIYHTNSFVSAEQLNDFSAEVSRIARLFKI